MDEHRLTEHGLIEQTFSIFLLSQEILNFFLFSTLKARQNILDAMRKAFFETNKNRFAGICEIPLFGKQISQIFLATFLPDFQ